MAAKRQEHQTFEEETSSIFKKAKMIAIHQISMFEYELVEGTDQKGIKKMVLWRLPAYAEADRLEKPPVVSKLFF